MTLGREIIQEQIPDVEECPIPEGKTKNTHAIPHCNVVVYHFYLSNVFKNLMSVKCNNMHSWPSGAVKMAN